MSSPWVVRLPLSDAESASALRLHAGVEVLASANDLWVRGGALDEATEATLRKLPCAARYAVLPDEALVAWGERVPSGRLPEGTWTPIAARMRPVPREAAGPGSVSQRVTLKLARGGAEREASILVVDRATFAAWVETAPAPRLKPLVFALSEDDRVLVRGTPLPPLEGTRYAEEGGIAVPCGWEHRPRVEASVLREAIALAPGDLALFAEDGSWERVTREALVKVSRSAIRMSSEGPRGRVRTR